MAVVLLVLVLVIGTVGVWVLNKPILKSPARMTRRWYVAAGVLIAVEVPLMVAYTHLAN